MKAVGNFSRDRRPSGGRNFGRRDFGPRSFDRGENRGGNRQMFDAVCSNCGNQCQVPFRPTGDKPVYCSNCFEKMGGQNDRQSPDRPRFEDRKPSFDQNINQFNALNVKLDKILKLLEPRIAEPAIPAPDMEVSPKAKRATKKTASAKKK